MLNLRSFGFSQKLFTSQPRIIVVTVVANGPTYEIFILLQKVSLSLKWTYIAFWWSLIAVAMLQVWMYFSLFTAGRHIRWLQENTARLGSWQLKRNRQNVSQMMWKAFVIFWCVIFRVLLLLVNPLMLDRCSSFVHSFLSFFIYACCGTYIYASQIRNYLKRFRRPSCVVLSLFILERSVNFCFYTLLWIKLSFFFYAKSCNDLKCLLWRALCTFIQLLLCKRFWSDMRLVYLHLWARKCHYMCRC